MRNRWMWVALGAGAYWASKQPGGIPGTWKRLQQGVKDIAAGQDPQAVGRRFIAGRDEEPAGMYTEEPGTTTSTGEFQSPYRDYVSGGV